MTKTQKQEVGDIGEKISSRFFVSKGFQIIDKNYRKKWGEIDIIIKKRGRIHFIEVKTVSCSVNLAKNSFFSKWKSFFFKRFFSPEKFYTIQEVSCETGRMVTDEYRPEDNLHLWKLNRIKKAILSYLGEKKIYEDGDWQFDAITVRLDSVKKVAIVEYLEDIIL